MLAKGRAAAAAPPFLTGYCRKQAWKDLRFEHGTGIIELLSLGVITLW